MFPSVHCLPDYPPNQPRALIALSPRYNDLPRELSGNLTWNAVRHPTAFSTIVQDEAGSRRERLSLEDRDALFD